MSSVSQRQPLLAVDCGSPVRAKLLPYGRQSLDEDDIRAVVEVLHSDWLTTGPVVEQFEQAFAAAVGAHHAVAVSNGTAALHVAMCAAGIGPGDEVIVPAMTFVATANCVVYRGATPVFADVDPETLLIDPADVERKITSRTRAIIAVDYAGQPCNYAALRALAKRHHFLLADDAAHSLGARCGPQAAGTLADLNAFSFHPVKHITTGEGGMVTCSDTAVAASLRAFRNHGITSDHRRTQPGSFSYDVTDLGYNYRLSDFQCALGMSQLRKLPQIIARRQAIAAAYDAAFASLEAIAPLRVRPDVFHAYHLYVMQLDRSRLTTGRAEICRALLAEGIGVNVHYLPVHLHRFYRERFRTGPGQCPVAEAAYERLITLPMFHGMSDADVCDVVEATRKVVEYYTRR